MGSKQKNLFNKKQSSSSRLKGSSTSYSSKSRSNSKKASSKSSQKYNSSGAKGSLSASAAKIKASTGQRTGNSMLASDLKNVSKARGKSQYQNSSSSRNRSYSALNDGQGFSSADVSAARRGRNSKSNSKRVAAARGAGPRYLAPDVGGEDLGDYSQTIATGRKSYMHRSETKRQQTKSWAITIAVAIVVACFVAFLLFSGIANVHMHKGLNRSELNSKLTGKGVDEAFVTLVVGLDYYKKDQTQADSTMLIRFDPETQVMGIMTLHKDIPVNIDGIGYVRLCDAYNYGGAAMMVDRVSDLIGLDIDHYVQCDMAGLIKIVDSLGGVDVDVPVAVKASDAEGVPLDLDASNLSAGTQHLNGAESLTFCRSENFASELYQTYANDRSFVQAALQNFMGVSVKSYSRQARTYAGSIKTDVNLGQVRKIAKSLYGISLDNIYQYGCPTSVYYDTGGRYIKGATLQIVVDESLAPILDGFLTGDYPATTGDAAYDGTVSERYENSNRIQGEINVSNATITVNNGSGGYGVANIASGILKEAGFNITKVGNADAQVYDETLVVYSKSEFLDTCTGILSVLQTGRAIQDVGWYSFDTDILVIIGSDFSNLVVNDLL